MCENSEWGGGGGVSHTFICKLCVWIPGEEERLQIQEVAGSAFLRAGCLVRGDRPVTGRGEAGPGSGNHGNVIGVYSTLGAPGREDQAA